VKCRNTRERVLHKLVVVIEVEKAVMVTVEVITMPKAELGVGKVNSTLEDHHHPRTQRITVKIRVHSHSEMVRTID
jgi:hypothetical protein